MSAIDELIEKIKRAKKEAPKIASKRLEPMMKDAIKYAIDDYYASYSPTVYQRTDNFRGLANDPQIDFGEDYIKMTIKSDDMSGYPGVFSPLDADTAFENMFWGGAHGHNFVYHGVPHYWLKAVSAPPSHLVDYYLDRRENEIQKILEDAVNEILN